MNLHDFQITISKQGVKMDSRVMVIGNDEGLVSRIASLLEEAGIEVATVSNDSEYLEELSEVSPNAVVVEEEPMMGGWEISSQIRHECDIPIMLLGKTDSEMAWVKAAAYGVDCYLPRSFSPLELVARLRALIRRHENARVFAPLHSTVG